MDLRIENRTWTVYMHTNKTNGKKYIGVTSRGNPNRRWKNGNGYFNNSHFMHAIKKYGWNEGFDHDILATDLSWEDAAHMEMELIAKYETENPNKGYNHSSGGDGLPGVLTSAAQKAIDLCSIPVHQYDKNGDYVATYKSLNEAERQTGISSVGIGKAIRGEYQQACGYYWSTERLDNYMPPHRVHHLAKPYYQFDLDGNFIASYESSYAAAAETGCTVQMIQVSAKSQEQGIARHGGGYLWTHGDGPKLLDHEPNTATPKKIKRVEDGAIFDSVHDAANAAGTSRATLRRHMKKNETTNGYHYQYIEQ